MTCHPYILSTTVLSDNFSEYIVLSPLSFSFEIPEKALSEHRGHIPTDGGSDGERSLCRRSVTIPLPKLVLCMPVE